MIIKQCFKFLNTLCLSLKNQVMFLIRQAYQVLRAVIILDAVKVMNYPSFRQELSLSFFPDKDMLPNISIPISSWMLRFVNKDITRTLNPTTLPIGVFFAVFRIRLHFSYGTEIYCIASWASFSKPSTNRFATIKTMFRLHSLPGFMSTIATPNRPFLNQPTTVHTGMLVPFFILFLCLTHISIIPYFYQYINLNQWELKQEMPK